MDKNQELDLALKFIEQTNRNLFLTGKAGTGKTTFLHHIKMHSLKRMVVVAPTGVAAINAKGVTIHSFFQLPFGPILPNTTSAYTDRIQRKFSKTKIDIIRSLDLVVIDEISMVRADLLDAIDEVLRRYKDRNLPFGGAQILMIGDLQQLSPVVKLDEWNVLKSYYQTAYFFSSNAYQKANIVPIELKHIYRQQNEEFISILNEIRNDTLSETSAKHLNNQHNPTFESKDNDGYITLTTHNRKADAINAKKLEQLKSKTQIYTAEINGNFNEKNYPNDEYLNLKVGAQVMFIKNDSSVEKRYYNGKLGTITALEKDRVIVQCSEDDIINVDVETWENIKYSLNKDTKEIKETLDGSYTQVPLRLAWAITIHKSQGLTFEKAIIDAEEAFAHGQTYVALSRCKTLEGIVLKTPIRSSSIINDKTVNSFNKSVEENLPNSQILQKSKKDFQLNLLSEIFNFHSFLHPTNRLIDIYYNNKTSFKGTIIEPLKTLKDDGVVPLLKVNNSFRDQLLQISVGINEPEKDEHIQERFSKAIDYFITQVNKHIIPSVESINYTTDNKAVEKDFKKQLQDLEEQLLIKLFVLGKMKDGFSAQKYLKIRAESVLQEMPKKKRKPLTNGSLKNVKLFEQLSLLRESISVSENIPRFQVFTQKSLYEMCEELPVTSKQLLKINGMGKIRVQKYGEEILEVVQEYCDDNNIETVKDDAELITIKIDTKKVSLDLFKEGLTTKEIAKKRELTVGTIEGHLAYFIENGELEISKIIPKKKLEKAKRIILASKHESLSELKEILGSEYSWGELRIILKWMND